MGASAYVNVKNIAHMTMHIIHPNKDSNLNHKPQSQTCQLQEWFNSLLSFLTFSVYLKSNSALPLPDFLILTLCLYAGQLMFPQSDLVSVKWMGLPWFIVNQRKFRWTKVAALT